MHTYSIYSIDPDTGSAVSCVSSTAQGISPRDALILFDEKFARLTGNVIYMVICNNREVNINALGGAFRVKRERIALEGPDA